MLNHSDGTAAPSSGSAGPEAAPVPTDGTAPGRVTLAHVLPAIAFPVIGCVLYVVGMPVADIFTFLLGCGGIGVLVTIAVTGGRRLVVAAAHGVLALTGSK